MNFNYILAAAILIVGILYLLRRRQRMNKED